MRFQERVQQAVHYSRTGMSSPCRFQAAMQHAGQLRAIMHNRVSTVQACTRVGGCVAQRRTAWRRGVRLITHTCGCLQAATAHVYAAPCFAVAAHHGGLAHGALRGATVHSQRMRVAVFVGIPALPLCCCRTPTLLKPQGGGCSRFWRPGQLAGCRAARRRHRREGRVQSRPARSLLGWPHTPWGQSASPQGAPPAGPDPAPAAQPPQLLHAASAAHPA